MDRPGIDHIEATSPGFLGADRQDIIEKHYVITTRRYGSGGRWEVVVHHEGQDWTLPDAVLTAIRRHYDTIIDKQRRDNGRNAAAAQPRG